MFLKIKFHWIRFHHIDFVLENPINTSIANTHYNNNTFSNSNIYLKLATYVSFEIHIYSQYCYQIDKYKYSCQTFESNMLNVFYSMICIELIRDTIYLLLFNFYSRLAASLLSALFSYSWWWNVIKQYWDSEIKTKFTQP